MTTQKIDLYRKIGRETMGQWKYRVITKGVLVVGADTSSTVTNSSRYNKTMFGIRCLLYCR